MLTAFVMSMAVAAPVPPPAPPVATGPAPRILELKAGNNGKVMIAVTRMEKVQVGAVGVAVAPGGAAPPAVITREVPVSKTVELSEVKDLTVTTADGKKVELADALKRLEKGGVVVVSSDGKPVSPNFLKLFKDDVLVLTSPDLVAPVVGRPGGIRPLPAPIGPPVVLPANPGGVIQVAPALPVAPPAPVKPEPAPKPEK
jgi:hypothetical protein